MGLDIGPDAIKVFQAALADCKTVIWNGPMGVFEFDKFAAGTNAIVKFTCLDKICCACVGRHYGLPDGRYRWCFKTHWPA